MSYDVDYSIKEMFFDREAVQKRLDRAELKALSKIGAFIRKRARTKILRKRKKSAKPGEPPRVHTNDKIASLRNILFGLDKRRHSVVIGPVRLRVRAANGQTIPNLMEFGGTVAIAQEQHKRKKRKRSKKDLWYRVRGPKRAWKRYRILNARYGPHPFMRPALDEERAAGTIRDAWVEVLGA